MATHSQLDMVSGIIRSSMSGWCDIKYEHDSIVEKNYSELATKTSDGSGLRNVLQNTYSHLLERVQGGVNALTQPSFNVEYEVRCNLDREARYAEECASMMYKVEWKKKKVVVDTYTGAQRNVLVSPDLLGVLSEGRVRDLNKFAGFTGLNVKDVIDRMSGISDKLVYAFRTYTTGQNKITRLVKGCLMYLDHLEIGSSEYEVPQMHCLSYKAQGIVDSLDYSDAAFVFTEKPDMGAFNAILYGMCQQYPNPTFGGAEHVVVPADAKDIYLVGMEVQSQSQKVMISAELIWGTLVFYAARFGLGNDLEHALAIACSLHENKYLNKVKLPKVQSSVDLVFPALSESPEGLGDNTMVNLEAARLFGRVHQLLLMVLWKDIDTSARNSSILRGEGMNRSVRALIARDSHKVLEYIEEGKLADILKVTHAMRWIDHMTDNDLDDFRKVSVFEGFWLIQYPKEVLRDGVLKCLKKGFKTAIAFSQVGLHVDTFGTFKHEVDLGGGPKDFNIPEGGYNVYPVRVFKGKKVPTRRVLGKKGIRPVVEYSHGLDCSKLGGRGMMPCAEPSVEALEPKSFGWGDVVAPEPERKGKDNGKKDRYYSDGYGAFTGLLGGPQISFVEPKNIDHLAGGDVDGKEEEGDTEEGRSTEQSEVGPTHRVPTVTSKVAENVPAIESGSTRRKAKVINGIEDPSRTEPSTVSTGDGDNHRELHPKNVLISDKDGSVEGYLVFYDKRSPEELRFDSYSIYPMSVPVDEVWAKLNVSCLPEERLPEVLFIEDKPHTDSNEVEMDEYEPVSSEVVIEELVEGTKEETIEERAARELSELQEEQRLEKVRIESERKMKEIRDKRLKESEGDGLGGEIGAPKGVGRYQAPLPEALASDPTPIQKYRGQKLLFTGKSLSHFDDWKVGELVSGKYVFDHPVALFMRCAEMIPTQYIRNAKVRYFREDEAWENLMLKHIQPFLGFEEMKVGDYPMEYQELVFNMTTAMSDMDTEIGLTPDFDDVRKMVDVEGEDSLKVQVMRNPIDWAPTPGLDNVTCEELVGVHKYLTYNAWWTKAVQPLFSTLAGDRVANKKELQWVAKYLDDGGDPRHFNVLWKMANKSDFLMERLDWASVSESIPEIARFASGWFGKIKNKYENETQARIALEKSTTIEASPSERLPTSREWNDALEEMMAEPLGKKMKLLAQLHVTKKFIVDKLYYAVCYKLIDYPPDRPNVIRGLLGGWAD